MNQSDDRPLSNPIRGYIRNFLLLLFVFLALSCIAILFFALPGLVPGPATGGPRTVLLLIVLLCLPLSVSMLVSVLFTIPPARRADRLLTEFRDGRYLVHWTYAPEEWQAYVESERERMLKGGWWLVGLVVFPIGSAGLAAAWANSLPSSSKIGWSCLVTLILVILGGIVVTLIRLFVRKRCKNMLAEPKTYIGQQGFYCGGRLNFWGSQMRGLQNIRVLPQSPSILELTIGLSRGGKQAATAITAATLAASRFVPLGSYATKHLIPIPHGATAEVERLLQTLTAQLQ